MKRRRSGKRGGQGSRVGRANLPAYAGVGCAFRRRWIELIRRLLSKRPEERHATPADLATDLQTIVQQLAAGTIPKEDSVDLADTQSLSVVAAVPVADPAVSTDAWMVMPISSEKSKPATARAWQGAGLSIGLAAAGGMGFLVMVDGGSRGS